LKITITSHRKIGFDTDENEHQKVSLHELLMRGIRRFITPVGLTLGSCAILVANHCNTVWSKRFLDHFVVASNVAHSVLQDILLHACIFGVFLGQGESCYLVTSLESGTRSSEPHTASAESA